MHQEQFELDLEIAEQLCSLAVGWSVDENQQPNAAGEYWFITGDGRRWVQLGQPEQPNNQGTWFSPSRDYQQLLGVVTKLEQIGWLQEWVLRLNPNPAQPEDQVPDPVNNESHAFKNFLIGRLILGLIYNNPDEQQVD